MKKILLLSMLLNIALQANCNSYYLLGSKKQTLNQTISSKDTVIWKSSNNRWDVSKLQESVDLNNLSCGDSTYLLINNDSISYKTEAYTKDSYSLKRGWNYLSSHVDGVDIEKTFENTNGVEFVYVYDRVTQAWAGHSPLKYLQDMIDKKRILSLKKIEPNIGFYVYSTKHIKVDIKSVEVNLSCSNFINNDKYNTLLDSGINREFSYNNNKNMALKSRYLSHYKRGVYDDTRVVLIYPKLDTGLKRILKYGPAKPKTEIEYSKEYEGLKFYMFDYIDEKCYQGIFPSMKIPPFASLQEI